MIDHLQQLVLHCYYVGELAAGRRAVDRLLSTPDLEQDVEFQCRVNRTWYTPTLQQLCPSAFHRRIDVEPAHDGWSTFNPTVATVGGELIGIVRSSNYEISDGQHYVMPEVDHGTIRTDNLLLRFDADLGVIDRRPLAGPDYPATDYPVHGLEDCRLRHTQTGIGVSATIRDAAPFDGRCRICTVDLDIATGRLSNLLVLDGVGAQEHEKNWMPILGRGGWLYACTHGGHVVTVDEHPDVPGAWQMVQRSASPPIVKRFRGGSQLVPWRGGWLAVVHEVTHLEQGRAYEHRFVWFNERLEIDRVSPWFAFRETKAIEFAAGLAIHAGRVVVSYGVRDAEAWLCSITEDDVDSCLQDVAGDRVRAAG